MKYAFIVNPVSGQGKHDRGIAADIEELIKGNPNRDIKLYYTRGETDATYLSGLLAETAPFRKSRTACTVTITQFSAWYLWEAEMILSASWE